MRGRKCVRYCVCCLFSVRLVSVVREFVCLRGCVCVYVLKATFTSSSNSSSVTSSPEPSRRQTTLTPAPVKPVTSSSKGGAAGAGAGAGAGAFLGRLKTALPAVARSMLQVEVPHGNFVR